MNRNYSGAVPIFVSAKMGLSPSTPLLCSVLVVALILVGWHCAPPDGGRHAIPAEAAATTAACGYYPCYPDI